MIGPPTQPMPSSTTLAGSCDPPWKKIAIAPVMLLAESTTESDATLALPDAFKFAPAENVEFAQPLPLVPLLAHGQARPVPSPKQ